MIHHKVFIIYCVCNTAPSDIGKYRCGRHEPFFKKTSPIDIQTNKNKLNDASQNKITHKFERFRYTLKCSASLKDN